MPHITARREESLLHQPVCNPAQTPAIFTQHGGPLRCGFSITDDHLRTQRISLFPRRLRLPRAVFCVHESSALKNPIDRPPVPHVPLTPVLLQTHDCNTP
jgi:hypothetical protein